MIVVIADDLTGAAEFAGISIRYGLRATVCIDAVETSGEDVVIICSDSRSLDQQKAIDSTINLVKKINALKPSFIYKKIDSVLRGHVVAELNVQMKEQGLQKALIMPANPSLGRTIHNGIYFIDGKEITQTGFANDPEFPVKSSSVTAMLGGKVKHAKNPGDLPISGIATGDATTTNDIKEWVNALDESWVHVGAGDFYTAWLEKQYSSRAMDAAKPQQPHVYISGTALPQRKRFINSLQQEGCVLYLPAEINSNWIEQAVEIIAKQKRLVIAIDESDNSAPQLRSMMAKAVKKILEHTIVPELFIEGGSTAAAILQELGIKKLIPVNELARGVVRMRSGDMFITMKPGSYELPDEISAIYQTN